MTYHTFSDCPKVIKFWNYWINWWENTSGLQIKKSPTLYECIFGFPNSNSGQKEKIYVLNYCILYTKYYIYIQKLLKKNNSSDVSACLMQIKAVLEIELTICQKKIMSISLKNFFFL